ncbi:MAG: conjugal transfer protein TraX [Lachnospiraceae bacterium]|nr:conjugal transfer protein TraX [Lachnospiraceae bacterium]
MIEHTEEVNLKEKEKSSGLSGSTLKIIAEITMLIDHTAATILERYLDDKGVDLSFSHIGDGSLGSLQILYFAMRLIGRIAFPIFCFLLVEGFYYTHHLLRYSGRLFLFALISEIPFDLAISDKWISWKYQSVYWTLLIGLLTLWGIEAVKIALRKRSKGFRIFVESLVAIAGMAVALLLRTDYSAAGVLTIVLMYDFRKNRSAQMAIGCTSLCLFSSIFEFTAYLTIPLVRKYNGKRGLELKYLFYAFYPVHLGILALICWLTGYSSLFK